MGDRISRFFFFDKPLTSDWVFWVFGIFVLIYSFGSLNDYYAGTSLTSLTAQGLLAAFIDLAILPCLGAFIFPTSLILIARKIARKKKNRHEPGVVNGDRSGSNGPELKESDGFRVKLQAKTMKQAFTAGTAVIILLAYGQVSQKYDLPKLFANFQEAPAELEIEAVSGPGAVKRAPTQETPSVQTPEINPTESATKSAAPQPEPTPVASWWPAYFSPWGNTIAYKYGHHNGNCTNTEPSWQCQGYHYVEFIVTEPCSAFSVEFTDESGEIYIAYYELYVPTGQIFSDGNGDLTPQSPGRVTNITC